MCKSRKRREIVMERIVDLHSKEERAHLMKAMKQNIYLPGASFLLVYTLLFVWIAAISKSTYYLAFYAFPVGFHAFAYFIVIFYTASYTKQEFNLQKLFEPGDLYYAISWPSKTQLQIVRWTSTKFLIFLLLLFMAFRAFWLYPDKVDPPTGSSSCTTDTRSTNILDVFNPLGFFKPGGKGYRETDNWKFCPMQQTWANPNLGKAVIGFNQSPLSVGKSACAHPKPAKPITHIVQGFPDVNVCSPTEGYPSPVLGIPMPFHTGQENPDFTLCPGNQGIPVCVSKEGHVITDPNYECPQSQYRMGLPKYICATCGNFFMQYTPGNLPLAGYEHCGVYDPSQANNPACTFCPGQTWLADEVYSEEVLLWDLIISVLMLVTTIIEYITMLVLIKNARVSFEKEHHHHKTNNHHHASKS